MSAVAALFARRPERLRILSASGQLGYGIPAEALAEGLRRRPDFIGADMGSVDPGPAYLGSGELATSPLATRRDLSLVLEGARSLGVPLIIGTAGTAGAAPHLETTLDVLRDIAREKGLRFRMATIRSDLPRERVKAALASGELNPLGAALPVTAEEIDACTHVVGQMGCEPFERALALEPDVIVAGRSCDTAIFAAIPKRLGFDMAHVMHMAKIIECTSVCCEPGGRDAMLAELDHQGFVLESMHPGRRATPLSVAAHSLYEQADPTRFTEPDGTLHVGGARYEAVDARRTRVSGARWEPAAQTTLKIEGAAQVGHRAVLLAASVDPGFIAQIDATLAEVERITRSMVAGDYSLYPRLYGLDAARLSPPATGMTPREIFVMVEVIASDPKLALAAAKTFKQYLLHHGFPGRKCTGGNLAFPFTPPEVLAGAAWRFALYHVMPAPDAPSLFPVAIEEVGA
ncbi:MAG: hypothetical protein RL322_260 [Pseudomonadota bacterium]|jgi:hypothetical protein